MNMNDDGSITALKKIINGGLRSKPTRSGWDKMSRVELALRAAEEAIMWGNVHINSQEELEEFKSGLIRIANEQN